MSDKKTWVRGAVAGVSTLALVGTIFLPATALNKGTVSGDETQGCQVTWNVESLLDTDLQPNDPRYPNLTLNEKDEPNGAHYEWDGFVKEVSPKLDGNSRGYMELGHHYHNGNVSEVIRQASADTRQHWRVNLGTQEALKNAKVVLTLPPQVSGKPVAVDVNSGIRDVNGWPAPYSTYRDGRTPIDPSQVVEGANGTWTINLGDLPANSSRVVDFNVHVGTSVNVADQFIAKATLTARKTTSECLAKPQKPADVVREPQENEWNVTENSCDSRDVTESATRTTTSYVWNEAEWRWDLGSPSSETITRTRKKTADEAAQCPKAPKVEKRREDKEAVSCLKPEVAQTEYTTTTPIIWNTATNDWEPDTANERVTTADVTRPKTDQENENCKNNQPAPVVGKVVKDAEDVSCLKPQVAQREFATSTSYKWDEATKVWKLDPSDITETPGELVAPRDKTADEVRNCQNNQPEPVTGKVVKDAEDVSCLKPQVAQREFTTSTPYKWDDATKAWKLDPSAMTEAAGELVAPRDKTNEEVAACKNNPPQATVNKDWSEWAVSEKTCEKPRVTETRTRELTTYEWDEATKVWKPVVKPETETRDRDKRPDELKECRPADQIGQWSAWRVSDKSCEKNQATESRTRQVVSHVWDDATSAWKPVTNTESETNTRALNAAELNECKPADKHGSWSEWTDTDKSCEKTTVTQARSREVTVYHWDDASKTWKPVLTTEVANRERAKTPAEIEDCRNKLPKVPEKPQKPEDKPEQWSNWQASDVSCDKAQVTETRTRKVVTHEWDEATSAWKPVTKTETETRERDKTAEEMKSCEGTDKPSQPGDKPSDKPSQPGDKPSDKPSQPGDKPSDKPGQPGDKPGQPGDKPGDKPGQPGDKPGDKPGQPGDKPGDKPGQPGDKPGDQPSDKPESNPADKDKKPEDKIVVGEWTDQAVSCGEEQVTQTRVTTVTPYTWDDATKTWKLDESKAVSTTETQKRDKTAKEKAACPAVKAGPGKSLAKTGANLGVASATLGTLALAGAALIAMKRRRG